MSLSQKLQNIMYGLSDFSDPDVRDRANHIDHLMSVVSQREISSVTPEYREAESALDEARQACEKAKEGLEEIAGVVEKLDRAVSVVEQLIS